MSDFEYDCLQKKRIANQAKYRRRGSKSKKCTLPSDRMTQKQWKDRCGPVISYSFSKPIEWDEFKKLPANIQAEYIAHLQQKYGATAVDLGKMFGVQALTVRRHAEANSLGVEFPRGHAMSSARKAEWDKFLNNTANEDVGTVEFDSPDEDCKPDEEISLDEPALPIEKPMKMNHFSLHFSGTIDISMIANSLQWMLGESPVGEIEIICNLS